MWMHTISLEKTSVGHSGWKQRTGKLRHYGINDFERTVEGWEKTWRVNCSIWIFFFCFLDDTCFYWTDNKNKLRIRHIILFPLWWWQNGCRKEMALVLFVMWRIVKSIINVKVFGLRLNRGWVKILGFFQVWTITVSWTGNYWLTWTLTHWSLMRTSIHGLSLSLSLSLSHALYRKDVTITISGPSVLTKY